MVNANRAGSLRASEIQATAEPLVAEIYRQNKQRPRNVPTDVIRKLAEKYEPPTWAECHPLRLLA